APSLPVLAERIGWDLDRLEAIHAYRSSTNSYYFSTLDEILEPFSAAGFELQWVSEPDYEMGSQCPVICFRRAAP
ncbi:MAG TPA: hypothetical protein VMI31_08395, partial [Fimbriimonadaceae bacterium]|nr:hypothetical protein [Fimbriimonadaceae bacterium]